MNEVSFRRLWMKIALLLSRLTIPQKGSLPKILMANGDESCALAKTKFIRLGLKI